MSFVEDEFEPIALYMQNELTMVEPGNEAEITFPTHPGRVVKADGRLDRLGAGAGAAGAVGEPARRPAPRRCRRGASR